MLAKIIFLLLFLIITFSSSGLCIRNEDQIDAERASIKGSKFFPDENAMPSVEARQNYGGHYQSEGSKFAFPSRQDHFYNANEVPASANLHGRPQANIVRENPQDAAFSTGQRLRPGNYPASPNYPNTLFASGGNGRDVPNYRAPNAPNYPAGNYAQGFDYSQGNRPGFDRAPVPLAPFTRYQHQSASPYLGGFPAAAAGPPGYAPVSPGYPPLHPGYPPLSPGYAPPSPGAPGVPLLFANPLASIFNLFRAPPSSPFAEQFTRALEDIAQNDDLQCVPRLLCQVAGDPSRRKHLPDLISTPALTALIAAVPPSSPKLAFGRAALLGLTGGEESCHSTYPRCPRNEDSLLYYLNNHKGGFFRFFNGGGPFADQTNQHYPSAYDDHHQGSNHNQNYDSSSSGINLGSIGSGLGLISNIASLFPSINPLSSENYKTMSDTVGNLFSNLVGSSFSSRQLSKRSVVESAEDIENKELKPEKLKEVSLKDSGETKESKTDSIEDSEENGEAEGRIINKQIYSDYFEHHDDVVVFPHEDEREHKGKRGRRPKVVHSHNYDRDEDKFTFPSKYHDDTDDRESNRGGKGVNFEDEFNYAPQYPFPDDQDYRPYQTHMIFPDRTGTGNLRFDNDKFHNTRDRDRDRDYDREHDRYRDHNYNRDHNYDRDHYRDRYRYGKILSRPVYNRDYYRPNYDGTDRYHPYYSSLNNYDYHNDRTTQRPDYSQSYYTNRYTTERPYYNDDYYSSRYTTRRPYTQYYYPTKRPDYEKNYYTTPRPSYNYDYYKDRYTTPKPKDPDLNVYVTNSKGVVDYYIKPNGEKVYV